MNIEEANSRLIVTSGDNLLVLERNSGNSQGVKIPPPDLPPNLTKGQLEVLNKEDRTIISVAISRDNKYVAVATENKQVVVYDDALTVRKNFIVNRTASKVVFTNCGDILVADRTGDVYLYKFSDTCEPTLVLGHLSMILDMILSDCGNYIVTCDRDEKIRVSHFPNTYNIVSYCLGHEEFVTTIKIVNQVLFSASGDGTVRMWNYLKGEQLGVINTNQYVDDLNLLEQFSHSMDKENVDVTALPITDMQVYCNNNCMTVAVSLYSYNAILMFKVALDTCKWTHFKKIDLGIPHKFHLSASLYVFNNSKVSVYDDCHIETTCLHIENFYNKFKNVLKISDNNFITVLYKRKFDNVHDYLERKKLRLESGK